MAASKRDPLAIAKGNLKVAEESFASVLKNPDSPEMNQNQIVSACDAINQASLELAKISPNQKENTLKQMSDLLKKMHEFVEKKEKQFDPLFLKEHRESVIKIAALLTAPNKLETKTSENKFGFFGKLFGKKPSPTTTPLPDQKRRNRI